MANDRNSIAIMMIARIDSPSRLRNCKITLRYYSSIFHHIYFYEVDTESRIPSEFKEDFPTVKFIFKEDGSKIFHRTYCMNYGFRDIQSRHRFIANIDVDVIVPSRQLHEANSIITTGKTPMVIPYNGICISLNEDITMSIYSSSNPMDLLTPDMGHAMFGTHSFGGAYVVDVDMYEKLGWENENIIGWGPEDIERVLRLDILGYQPCQIVGYVYHLNHYRGVNSGDFDVDVAFRTKKEFCFICNMKKEELTDYIKSWNWINP